MKILAIGDPHGDLEKVKSIPLRDISLILLTGDLGSASLMRKMAFENIEREKKGLPKKEFSPQERKRAFMEAYTSSIKIVKYLAKYSQVYTIYGNVENNNQETRKISNEIEKPLPYLTNYLNSMKNVRVINNRKANFNGVKIGGLQYFEDVNWVREFKPNKYRERMIEAKKETDKAKRILKGFKGIDILVCHQPPYGLLDKVAAKFAPKHWQGKNAGSKIILSCIQQTQPDYVFCGHIHEGEGKKRLGTTKVYNLGIAGYKIVEY